MDTNKHTPSHSPADAARLYQNLSHKTASVPHATSRPKKTLDTAVNDIYLQAHKHRSKLVTFYIRYTVAFSIFVVSLVAYQAFIRSLPGKETIEVIPEGTLSLLVAGMFGQFISLLTIVTKKVWTFEPFLKHHLDYKSTPATVQPDGGSTNG